jgi:hypothetical protein
VVDLAIGATRVPREVCGAPQDDCVQTAALHQLAQPLLTVHAR